MSLEIPPGAKPSAVYGTPAFERARYARMSSTKAPRRHAVEPVETITAEEAFVRWSTLAGRKRPKISPVRAMRRPLSDVDSGASITPTPTAPPIVWVVPEGPPTSLYLAWLTRNRVYVMDIIDAVVEHFDTTLPDVLGKSRHVIHIWPRHVAIFLARAMTDRSMPELGRVFGGRDHTTILHAARRVERLFCSGDEKTVADITAIKIRLGVEP